ncbi:glycerol-3-phosphate acyltransferase [Bacillus sp. KH172YL63]|uniref:glycerol-3-phosphate acyltransferase n=1 Tax=Bacillus sp. KH172YL63 TaxID=2709784 RepID=UPI0015634C63|nr:glycerol-3-phosphate acyltransferase [Bacillus sp. KH172YL63]
MILTVLILYSYILGSVTGAYFVVRMLTGEDVRKLGSGNVGATNAGRIAGKKGFLLTLLIDALKVYFALSLTAHLANGEMYVVLSAIFVMIGHGFPVVLGFHGGKGVVVYLTTALIFCPWSIVIFSLVMGSLYLIIRRYKFSGFVSMASIPLTAYMMDGSLIMFSGLAALFFIMLLLHKRSILQPLSP